MSDPDNNTSTDKPVDNLMMANRFRGFLPVVVDVETAGFNSKTDALLEIAAVLPYFNDDGKLCMGDTISSHVQPFEGANMEAASLAFTGIDPHNPFRFAVSELEALKKIFDPIRKELKATKCTRAILVGHNPSFDLAFVKAAATRTGIKHNPFHLFSTFDTATLGGLAYGQTVLARAAKAAGIAWDSDSAHSARYDTEKTAELFCKIVNAWGEINPASQNQFATKPKNPTP